MKEQISLVSEMKSVRLLLFLNILRTTKGIGF